MSKTRLIFLGITAAISLLYVYMTWIFAPPDVVLGENVRIFFQHVAPALVAYGLFGGTLLCGLMYLWKGNMKYDILGAVSIKLGLLFTTITLLSGMLWAEAAWNSPWNWDPRETTTLILWIAYACILAYRSSVSDREARAQFGSIFGIVAFPMVILSYLSIRIWNTLHPIVIEASGLQMEVEHMMTLFVAMIAVTMIALIMVDLAYKVDSAHEKLMRIRMSRS
ncbi:MAG: cytochrome c biogenesis protein [Candidatus Thorarchaeota archaeon]|nr:cytochrome c biogenesis protein [Candidatus Thorarchaeota archaeon]